MTKKTRPTYTPEYRLKTVKLVTEQHYSIIEAAKHMEVGKSTVDKWVRDYRLGRSTGTIKGAPISEEQQKIRELERKIKYIEEQNEILKKATALLMSDSLRKPK